MQTNHENYLYNLILKKKNFETNNKEKFKEVLPYHKKIGSIFKIQIFVLYMSFYSV